MITDPTILSELQNTAPALAGISRQMPYDVPEGYFEHLASHLLDTVHASTENAEVPAGYFDHFADQMLELVRQQDAQQELAAIAPTLSNINRQMPYAVPDGYFESLEIPMAEPVDTKVELEQIAPALAAMPRQMPYYVPAGYFEQLSVPTLQNSGKVVSITRKTILRIAIAAAVLLAGFTFWQMSVTDTQTTNLEVATATVDTVEIPQEFSMQLANLDASTLESAFTDIGQSTGQVEAAYLLETDNFEQALQSISTEAISQQLEQHPATKKNI